MRERRNLRVHFVGHADAQPLSPALVRVFEDNAGLSRERAGEVAEHFKTVLELPPDAITYEWAGDTQPVASNATAEGRAQNRRVEVEVWYDEASAALRDEEVVVADDIKRIKVCRMETVCKMRYQEGHAPAGARQEPRRAAALRGRNHSRFRSFIAAGPPGARQPAGQAERDGPLHRLHRRRPLTGRDERIYGDHLSLSKARAHRVALAMQESLGLPTSAMESDGRGASQPVASNETAQGRALNRRVEVEFWYDDPLQELPDEPQLCPGDGDEEIVTKVYDPPWGRIAPLAAGTASR